MTHNLTDPRTVIFRDEAQDKIRSGAKKVYEVAKAAYGASAGNVLLEKPYGEPVLSRDGVTNVRDLYLEDNVENQVVRAIVQASKKSNEVVGDGTTAVVILSYHLLLEAQKRVAGGINPMIVAKELQESGVKAMEYIDSISKPCTNDLLLKAATVSAGDEAIGELITESITEVGSNGGVIVEEVKSLGIYNEIVEGFYFQKGFKDPRLINNYARLMSEYENVHILLSDKPLNTIDDIAPLLDEILENGIKKLVIIGDVEGDALTTLAYNKATQGLDVTVVDPPVIGSRTLFLEDMAILTGGKVLYQGFNNDDFSEEYLGAAQKVVIKPHDTTIIGGDGDPELIQMRLDELQKQLKISDHPDDIAAIKDRISKLTGKVAIIRVGGAIDFERVETKLRVDDAVCAVQAAVRGGVVAGGGTALARVTGTNFDQAFQQPFRQLVDNAGLNPEELLFKTLEKPYGYGYNLKDITDKPVDLFKSGVVDPTLVIKEVITNATSVVSRLITTSAAVVFAPTKDD
jgi:chaperonin GroEL